MAYEKNKQNTRKEPIRDNNQGYLPPSDIKAEEVVLGAIMIEKAAIHLIGALLKPEAFYSNQNQLVCTCILSLYKASKKIDIVTVMHEARRLGILEELGGAYYITELTNAVASSANIGHHISIINYTYQLRELIRFGTEIKSNAYDMTNSPFELITEGVQFMNQLKNLNVQRTEKGMNELIQMMVAEMNRPKVNGLLGISSGSVALDSITKGYQPGQLIIPAGRPAMGKTADLCSQVAHIGYTEKIPVGVFSLEMSSVQLTFRIASNLSEISQTNLKQNDLDEIEKDRIITYCEKISEAPIFMDDTPGINIDELIAKATLWKALYDIKILFIDYLQLITITGGRPGNREADVSEISRKLKSMAKTLEIPVVALCQLSRAVEGRDKENFLPKLSDLRESGSIEQDADIVYFLWRPEYYNLSNAVEFPHFNLTITDVRGLLVKKVAKCREEETGLVPLKFIGNIMKVADHQRYLDKSSQPEIAFKVPKITISDEESEPPF